MIDGLLLLLGLAAAAAAGLVCLRALGASAPAPGDRLLDGLAAGLGLAGIAGLVLASAGLLRPAPIGLLAVVALLAGGRLLAATLDALDPRALRRAWPVVAVCALVLVAELPAMIAPPIGGDQTKYHLPYARLYAAHGGLVATPWSFWGQMQYLANFVFALGFALRGDVLARLFGGAFGVLAALAVARLVRDHLSPRAGAIAGGIVFTLPITWSLMTRAGSDLALILYTALAVDGLLAWRESDGAGDLGRAALFAGFAGGTKIMGLLVPVLVGGVVLFELVRRALPVGKIVLRATTFGMVLLLAASSWYVRNAVDTGNPIYPFGFGIFGGRNWSAAASEYLGDYYQQYQTTHARRRDGSPYVGLEVVRFPWDLTMHPESFENAAREAYDIGPFALAFAPALLFVRRRRSAVLLTAGLGFAYAAIIAVGAWAHPRYVLPGVVLLLVAAVPAARVLLPRGVFAAVVVFTVLGNLALTTRLFQPLWPDQVRVAAGRLAPDEFLRRHSPRFAFWERANVVVPAGGRVLVLEKVPHPYYIERPFVLGSYLEQGLIDYRSTATPEALATAAHGLGVTHVAVDLAGLDAGGDPFEATVARLWRAFLGAECDAPLVREGGFALYALHDDLGATALAYAGRSR